MNSFSPVCLKGKIMSAFLALLEKLASEVNANNIESFVSFVEKLIALAESVKQDVSQSMPSNK